MHNGPDNDRWHEREADALAIAHGVNPAHGLPDEQVRLRAERHGPNELQAHDRPGPWRRLLERLSGPALRRR